MKHAIILAWLLTAIWAATTRAADEPALRVQVADPYLELHTAPGAGFPVFYVVERNEWIEVLKRKTDWFKIRTANEKEGWVSRLQMENTLTELGEKFTVRDTLIDDYLSRRLEVGFGWGQFEEDPVQTMRVAYQVTPGIAAELSSSIVTGIYSSTGLNQINLQMIPYPEARFSPFFTLGTGTFRNIPKATLVGAKDTTAETGIAGLGVRYHLTRNFLLRADYRQYVAPVSEQQADLYTEWTIGLAVFF
jgi:hypothetical protein